MRIFGIRTIGLVAVCAALGAAGCGGDDARASTAAPPATADAGLTAVTGLAVIKQDIPVIVRATGTFTPDEASDVAAPVSGQVVKTLVNVGDIVKSEQPLLLLDDRDARLRLDQARASLERAEADAQKAKTDATRSGELFQKGFTTRSEYERLVTQDTGAGAAVAQARAQLASAQKAVDDSVVRAPFAGHVTARGVAAGEYVTPASKVATIVRIAPIKLELMVKEADAVKVRRGLSVQAEVSGYPGVVFAGSVSALNVAIDPNSRAMTVEATFPNTDARVTPGMFGTAQIRLPATETAMFVPSGAVLKIANTDAVYVIEGDRAQLRIVQLGDARDGMVRIESGVQEGAIVATNNLDKLVDGAAVRLTQASDGSVPAARVR
jgi:RND family efflux transporter MFP subunit